VFVIRTPSIDQVGAVVVVVVVVVVDGADGELEAPQCAATRAAHARPTEKQIERRIGKLLY